MQTHVYFSSFALCVTRVEGDLLFSTSIVDTEKDMIKHHFECDHIGKINEFFGSKIKQSRTSRKPKITQLALVQSLDINFYLPRGMPPQTPGKPGTALDKH